MTPTAASTVVLVRNAGDDMETLLLLRNSKLVFEGGTWVFPGGKIEPHDYPAGCDEEFVAARHAAVRETREEAGLVVDVDALVHISHWTTPLGLPRRYATWFFVCAFHDDTPVRVDDDEILDHCWLTPREALRRSQCGNFRLPTPTRDTLKTLDRYRCANALCEAMAGEDIHVFPPGSEYYRPPVRRG